MTLSMKYKKKTEAVLHIVVAPNTWHCRCGKEIKPGEQCGKIGRQVICMECLRKEVNADGKGNR